MGLRCSDCGDGSKVFDNYRQARGHVKFKSGGSHGDAQELPSDWKEMIDEVDEGNGNGSDDGSESSGSASSSDSPDASAGGSGDSDNASADSSSDDDAGSDRGIVSKIVDTDLRELI